MTEQVRIKELLIESSKLQELEIKDSKLKLIDKVIQDFAPELSYLYQFREDESEEQQTKTGRLHESRILGIILKTHLEGIGKITTGELVIEYKRYFKELARSTISNYLNILKRESTLYKEKDGRTVYYSLYTDPPKGIKPFWFTRIFCIVPAYFNRALNFAKLYINAEKYLNEDSNGEREVLIQNFKFITGLIILNIFKNRSSKCLLCQFSKSAIYKKLEEIINNSIRDRSDVLSDELVEDLIKKCSELPTFNGYDISEETIKRKIIDEIVRSANIYKKDLEFQVMLARRRKDLRLNQEKEKVISTKSTQGASTPQNNGFSSKIKSSLSW